MNKLYLFICLKYMENIIIVLLAFLIINIFWHSFILKKNTFFKDLKSPKFIIYFL